jgi:hypothetical protein
MHKLIFSITFIFAFYFSLTAQVKDQSQDLNAKYAARLLQRSPEQVAFKGYLISVQPALAGAYGYDISREGKVLISQRRNPFNNSPIGLRRKEDVIEVAKWQITQFNASKKPARVMNAPLPKNLSQQLKIQVH